MTQIAKWGNSLGLRLPKSIALGAHIDEGDTVDVSVKNGAIVIRTGRPTYSLGKISGVVLADHVKNLDWQARRVVFEAKAGADILTDVRERLRVLLGL